MGLVNEERAKIAREYIERFKRARSESSMRKLKAAVDNQIGYEILETGKSADDVKKEWGLIGWNRCI